MSDVLTVPNAITVVRLACIPWFLWLVFSQDNLSDAAYLLAVLGCTDWVDGQVARRFNQVSAFGKAFDPTVDRLMLLAAGITLLVKDAMPLWFGLVILAREVVTGLIAINLDLRTHGKKMDVQMVGKAGAFALMMSLPLFLVSVSGVTWHDQARFFAWVCGIPGLVLSWYSTIWYFRTSKKMIDESHSDTVTH